MTREEDLVMLEAEARSRALHKLRYPSGLIDGCGYVATDAIAVPTWTICAWAWMDGDREVTFVERLHFIDAARWRDQVNQLALLDDQDGAR